MDPKFYLRNSLLFEIEQKMEISSEASDKANLVEAVSANKEFSRFGYTLDTRGILALAHNEAETIKQIRDQVCEILDEAVGLSDYSHSEPFYPNFPEEVMAKSEMELALNAMLYYLFSQTDDEEMKEIAYSIREMVSSDSAERILRTPSTNVPPQMLNIIGYAEQGELERTLYSMTQALSLSQSKKVILSGYVEGYPEDWACMIFGSEAQEDLSIPSHEIRAEIAFMAYKNGRPEIADRILIDTEDILRLAAVISHNRSLRSMQKVADKAIKMDANLSIPPEEAVFYLGRQDKKTLKGFLESKTDLFTSVWHREKLWEKLMSRLDTRDASYPRVRKVFDNLCSGSRENEDGSLITLSAGQALERMMQTIVGDPDHAETLIREFADRYPRVFARNIVRIARELPSDSPSLNGLIRGIEENCGRVPAVQLLRLCNTIEKNDGWDWRIFTNQKGKIFAEENKSKKINIRTKCRLIDAIEQVLMKSMTDKPIGKVYIDPELETITAPLRNVRNASKGATLTKYSVLRGEPEKNLAAFGIFWKNAGNERADIDLSVTGFREGYQNPETIYYGNRKQSWGVHSGDYTDGCISREINGAVEYIFVDKKICAEKGIRYLVPEVHGFNIPFSEADSVRFCFMEKDGSLAEMKGMTHDADGNLTAPTFRGQLLEPSEIKTSYRLTQNSRTATPLLYDVKEDQYIWIDSNIYVEGIANAVNQKIINNTAMTLYEAKHNDYPSMKTLFEKYTEANGGEITQDMKEADLLFTFGNIDREAMEIKENAEIVSSLEIEKISADYCSLAQK